jgi:hypothetical protein
MALWRRVAVQSGVLEEKIHPYGLWVWCSGRLYKSHGSGCCNHTVLMV